MFDKSLYQCAIYQLKTTSICLEKSKLILALGPVQWRRQEACPWWIGATLAAEEGHKVVFVITSV